MESGDPAKGKFLPGPWPRDFRLYLGAPSQLILWGNPPADLRQPPCDRSSIGEMMILLGVVLLVAGSLLKISILWTIGIIILVLGVILLLLGSTGPAIAGADTSSDPLP